MCPTPTSSDSDKKIMKMWVHYIMLFKKNITYVIEIVVLQKGACREEPITNQVKRSDTHEYLLAS